MKIINIIFGFIVGIIATGMTVWLIMPDMILSEKASPYTIDETVEKSPLTQKQKAGLSQVFSLYINQLRNMEEGIYCLSY